MAAPTPPKLSGPGILYVTSRIASPDLDEKTYLKWYEDDHIAEIMQTSGISSALRYKSIDESVDKPFMVAYPMADLGFTQGEEFKKIKVHSDMLPNGGPIYDLADIDVRYYQLVQTYDPNGPTPEGRVKIVHTAGIEPGPAVEDEEFDKWYREEHLRLIAEVPGYIRSTRFKLAYYRTNAQSRVLKGLPPRDADLTIAVPPKWFAIHEFDREDVDNAALLKTAETEWAKKMLKGAETVEGGKWKLAGSFGNKKFFQ